VENMHPNVMQQFKVKELLTIALDIVEKKNKKLEMKLEKKDSEMKLEKKDSDFEYAKKLQA
jgi:hypothetical protein